LSWLWLWFVVPIFHLPALNIVQAIGISMVVGFLTMQMSTAKEEDDKSKKKINLIADLIFHPFLVVGIGYIVHLFL
jgi:hypothetical protein